MALESFSKVVAVVLLVVALYIFPTMLSFETQDELTRTVVYSETVKFIETVKNKGYISESNFTTFQNALNSTGNNYDINFAHHKRLLDSEIEGNVYYQNYANSDVMNELNDEGIYKMNRGDYIEIELVNTNKTMATKMQEYVYNTALRKEKIYVKYGGAITNEIN